jgi:hypothetical protein
MATQSGWVDWHKQYEDPESSLSRRLEVVRQRLRETLDAREGPIRLISMCAGQGLDVIPVLAASPHRADTDAVLVELDPHNAGVAEASAREAGLDRVHVRCADAAVTANYADAVPADVILACGIFGNISDEDIEFTVKHLPMLAAEGATVVWTRGVFREHDVTPAIRRWFEEAGFEELAFDAPEEYHYRVGVNRLVRDPDAFDPGLTLFRFLPRSDVLKNRGQA